jgi:hypothetical protein
MNRPDSVLAAALLSLAVLGCGGAGPSAQPSAPVPAAIGPHGGPAVALPDDRGYVEIVSEATRTGTDPVVAAYFLKPDLKTPLVPPPGDARIRTGDSEVPLSASPGPTRDPAGAGRMVSGPLPIDPDRIAGELSVTVDGQPFTAPFALGQ